jgi:hypothetical protein
MRPKVEVGSPHGEPAVRVRHGDGKNCIGKEWKGLEIVSKCPFSPSSDADERRTLLAAEKCHTADRESALRELPGKTGILAPR